jgi:hypothetical protein
LSGPVRAPPPSGSAVYSWGAGAHSLHDDETDKVIDHALVGPDSRIGRRGAQAILSVATSTTHAGKLVS